MLFAGKQVPATLEVSLATVSRKNCLHAHSQSDAMSGTSSPQANRKASVVDPQPARKASVIDPEPKQPYDGPIKLVGRKHSVINPMKQKFILSAELAAGTMARLFADARRGSPPLPLTTYAQATSRAFRARVNSPFMHTTGELRPGPEGVRKRAGLCETEGKRGDGQEAGKRGRL